MSSSLSKVSGVTHQVTNKLLERPSAEAPQPVMFSDCADRQLSDRPCQVVVDHLGADAQFVLAEDVRPGAG